MDGSAAQQTLAETAHEKEARPARAEREGRAAILSTHGLTKDFGKLRAVDGLDMQVRAGDVFGFLGPNGAGKTTVIRLVLGLIHPTRGHAEVAGHRVPGELREALRHVGGFVDDPTFYPLMSARRNLRLLGSITGPVGEERIDEVLETVGLRERADSRVGGFSHGMRQRLGIAQALLHAPELVVLDEPTSGLDPRGMKDVRELIRDLGRGGVTVFLSSHLLHEVQQVCTRAAIIDHGRVVVQGPVAELRPQGLAVKVMTDDQAKAAETARAVFGARAVSEDDGYLVVQAGDDVPELVRRLVADGLAVRSVVPATDQGLEDYFLELTARGVTVRDAAPAEAAGGAGAAAGPAETAAGEADAAAGEVDAAADGADAAADEAMTAAGRDAATPAADERTTVGGQADAGAGVTDAAADETKAAAAHIPAPRAESRYTPAPEWRTPSMGWAPPADERPARAGSWESSGRRR